MFTAVLLLKHVLNNWTYKLILD